MKVSERDFKDALKRGESDTKTAQALGLGLRNFKRRKKRLGMSSGVKGRRHFIIPDRQMKHGVILDYNKWLGMAIRDYKPDVVIDLGDFADFESISTHSPAGSKSKEGQRLLNDINAANEGDRLLNKGMGKFRPARKVRLHGNHEHRLTRYIEANPVLEGAIGLHMLDSHGWQQVPYENGSPGQIVIDGIIYAHYFANINTGKPIGGNASYKLALIGAPFVQGHVQGYDIGTKQYATGRFIRGIVAGSCYLHDEPYKGAANKHWRGVVVLNEVVGGDFCEMPLTLDYLCRKYEGMGIESYLLKRKKGIRK